MCKAEELLKFKLKPGAKYLEISIVSYKSDSDQKLVSKIFRDHVEWKGAFEVNGIYVDDLRVEEELSLLKDLRIG
ncbi:hypothetical protein HK098_007829, partial [Nowakowskiella sp. JEL0407]